MIIKRGSVVTHSGVHSWGSGRVVEVAARKATIQFSDGITRKIAASHYDILIAADPSTFIATEASTIPVVKKPVLRAKKPKAPKPSVEIC